MGLLAPPPGSQPGEQGHERQGKLWLDTMTGETREQGFPAEVMAALGGEGQAGKGGGDRGCSWRSSVCKGLASKRAQLILGPCQAGALALPGGTSSDKGNQDLLGQTA